MVTNAQSPLDGRGFATAVLMIAMLATGAQATAQCVPTWEWVGGLSGTVYALETFNDGSGPALWAAGENLTWPGGGPATVARWNGQTWVDSDANLPAPYALRLDVANLGAGDRL